jgi:multidrug efflux pump subunit AcrA (membrane-fusion protein)
MTTQQQVKDEFSLQRSLQQRKRRIRLFAIITLVVLALIFSIWTLSLVFYPKKETPRMSFFRREWVMESVSCHIARIDNGSEIKASKSGILVPFVRERQSVAAGDLIGLIAPESLSSQIDAYRQARDQVDQASYIASEIGNRKKTGVPMLPGDSLMRAAYRDLTKTHRRGKLYTYQDALSGLDKAYNRSVLEYISTGTPNESVTSLERMCTDMEATLQRSVNPDALLFAEQAGVVQFEFVPDTYDWDDNDWLRCADPAAQIEKIVSNSKYAVSSAYQSVAKGASIGSIDDFGSGRFTALITDPVDVVLKRKADDLMALYIPETDTLLQNLRIIKAEKNKERAQFILTYSSTQAPMMCLANTEAQLVLSRARGWVVPIRSLFNLSYEQREGIDVLINPTSTEDDGVDPEIKSTKNGAIATTTTDAIADADTTVAHENPTNLSKGESIEKSVNEPIDPYTVQSGEYYGLKMISGGRVYSIRVRVVASDGHFAVIESIEPTESALPLPDERSLYVVNPWTIEEGELIG